MDPEDTKPSTEPDEAQPSGDSAHRPSDGESGSDQAAPSPGETGGEPASSSSAGLTPVKRRKRRKKRKPEVQQPPPEPPAKPSRSTILATILLLLGVALAIGGVAFLMKHRAERANRFSPGKEVPVEITLVAADKANLACAATEPIAGKHCAFETPAKAWSQGSAGDDKTTLRPYTTTDRRNFLAAGLWSEPALAKARFGGRFSVKCVFVVEGRMKQLAVRWASAGPWSESLADWAAGTVKDCVLVGPAASHSATASAAAPSK
jgi:hypothetical protein